MSTDPTQPPAGGEPSEDELRAAYEAELSRVSVTDVIAQTAVSLLNLAARRIAPGAPGQPAEPSAEELEQARDAIDGVRALLEILDRRIPAEVRSLRDALSQLQMAYAAKAQAAGGAPADAPEQTPPAPGQEAKPAGEGEGGDSGPGPAESSGRLWVPGR
jgi:hypothetical protein